MHQVGLAQTRIAENKKRVVGKPRSFDDSLGRRRGKAVGIADDKVVEPFSGFRPETKGGSAFSFWQRPLPPDRRTKVPSCRFPPGCSGPPAPVRPRGFHGKSSSCVISVKMPIMMGRNFWSMDAFRLELKTSATRVCPSMDTGFICRKYILRFFHWWNASTCPSARTRPIQGRIAT